MAGDWIKFEHATPRKPEVCIGAELLKVSRREFVGVIVDYWIWLDQNASRFRNGRVTLVSRKSFEEALDCPGLAAILEQIGWAEFDDKSQTLTIVHWERHNGNTAKSRALGKDRAARHRNADVTPPSRSRNANTVTREEKRSTTPIVPTPGFDRFWLAWPASPRKVNRKGCAEKWKREGLEAMSNTVIAHVEAMRPTEQWRNGYDPSPETYLNQRRWEDGTPAPSGYVPSKKVSL